MPPVALPHTLLNVPGLPPTPWTPDISWLCFSSSWYWDLVGVGHREGGAVRWGVSPEHLPCPGPVWPSPWPLLSFSAFPLPPQAHQLSQHTLSLQRSRGPNCPSKMRLPAARCSPRCKIHSLVTGIQPNQRPIPCTRRHTFPWTRKSGITPPPRRAPGAPAPSPFFSRLRSLTNLHSVKAQISRLWSPAPSEPRILRSQPALS